MKVIEDKRKIRQLGFDYGEPITVGKNDVTEIKPYNENGEMAHVTWFAIVKNDEVVEKINGKYVFSVSY